MTAHQNKANRKYQDSLFRFLFGTQEKQGIYPESLQHFKSHRLHQCR